MINNVVLVGRMTRDAELRYTPQNKAVATFTLAVNRNFKNQNGEREADFINCILWHQQAENLANWAQKGTLVGVTGRIQTRNYENQQGQRVYVTEVIANSFQILESRNNQQGDQPKNQGNYGNQGNFQNGERRTSYVRICAAARPRRAASCRGSAPGADEYFTSNDLINGNNILPNDIVVKLTEKMPALKYANIVPFSIVKEEKERLVLAFELPDTLRNSIEFSDIVDIANKCVLEYF